jgi:hypothetical protein
MNEQESENIDCDPVSGTRNLKAHAQMVKEKVEGFFQEIKGAKKNRP